ncbi:MAG: ABC transporter substrate-binding protein [Myxococcota bacterium]
MRIASLLPGATEVVAALGLVEHLVGVSHECDHPGEVRRLPRLTSSPLDSTLSGAAIDAAVRSRVMQGLSLYDVDEAALAAVRPDVVLTQDTCKVCAVDHETVVRAARRVLGTHVQVLALSPMSFEDVLADIARVSAVADVDAAEVVSGLRARLEALRARTASLPKRRVLHLEWLEPPMVAGHWTPSLLEAAGGEPILAHPGRPTVGTTYDALAEQAVDVVLASPCGYPVDKTLAELEPLRQHRVLQGPVHVIDGNAYFNRPGPRLVDSAELAAHALHPEVFGAHPAVKLVASRSRDDS